MRVDKNYLLKKQYESSKNLEARISLHRYGTNPESLWEWVAKKYPYAVGNEILEVGCGTGRFWMDSLNYLPEDCRITLTDFSPGMLETAQSNLEHIPYFSFQVADVENLPFVEKYFDGVLAHFMLYHANNPERALEEMKRVQKSSGFTGIILPSEQNMEKLFTLLDCDSPVQARHFSAEIASDVLPIHFSNVTPYYYENKLVIDDVEPIIKYLRSLSTMDQKPEDFYSESREKLKFYLWQQGNLTLETSQCLYLCTI